MPSQPQPQKPKRITLAEHLRDEMLEKNEELAWAGHPDLCIAAYLRSGGKVRHPLNKIKAVLDAARRSPLFKHDGYIRACDSTGLREILHPVFALRNAKASLPQEAQP